MICDFLFSVVCSRAAVSSCRWSLTYRRPGRGTETARHLSHRKRCLVNNMYNITSWSFPFAYHMLIQKRSWGAFFSLLSFFLNSFHPSFLPSFPPCFLPPSLPSLLPCFLPSFLPSFLSFFLFSFFLSVFIFFFFFCFSFDYLHRLLDRSIDWLSSLCIYLVGFCLFTLSRPSQMEMMVSAESE